jgi:hypothetical protein
MKDRNEAIKRAMMKAAAILDAAQVPHILIARGDGEDSDFMIESPLPYEKVLPAALNALECWQRCREEGKGETLHQFEVHNGEVTNEQQIGQSPNRAARIRARFGTTKGSEGVIYVDPKGRANN